MAGITIHGASKGYGAVRVLQHMDLDVRSGEFMVIVGPSGCGKSTLLRSICGLETLDTGQIRIGDRDVTHVSPSDRGAAMVFQSYALYPHMTVAENMGFALRMEGLAKGEIAARVDRAAAILKLEDLLRRRPKELSGGQRQRVAIGRAIVRNPRVFLFDEPLSNLDAELRVQMRLELTALHRELGTTMIYVTHDQVEAMTMADRIVVMRKGVIEQIGAPTELYEKPANLFVAGFIGSPRMNFLKARLGPVQGGNVDVQLEELGSTLQLPAAKTLGLSGPGATLGVRPEHIRVTRAGPGPRMIVQHVENLGPHQLVYLRAGQGEPITVQYQGDDRLEIGHEVTLAFASDRTLLFA